MFYVVDTSVLLSHPKALERLSDKHIIIPVVVLTELEAKRHHPDLGFQARETLKCLERIAGNNLLNDTIPLEQGGSVRIEMNHRDTSSLPPHLQDGKNDSRILATTYNLSLADDVTLLTKDLPMRLHASTLGIKAEDIDLDETDNRIFSSQTLEISPEDMETLYVRKALKVQSTYPANTPVIVTTVANQSALAFGTGDTIELVSPEKSLIRPKNAMQTFALSLMQNQEIPIVSVGGLAGSGKTVLALSAGMDAVQRKQYRKLVVFRPVVAVGGQDLGFLPGTAEEKMAPWSDAIYDAMEAFMRPNEVEQAKRNHLIQVLPLTHIRGRTFLDSYVIVDETQNLDLMTLVTVLSRLGQGSKIVLTHDLNQRDNLRVGKNDGIAKVISALGGSELFAHISLVKSERSAVAQLVASSFDI